MLTSLQELDGIVQNWRNGGGTSEPGVRKGYPQRGTSCRQMLRKSLKEQRLSSLGISLREKSAMPVIRVVKGRVSGF